MPRYKIKLLLRMYTNGAAVIAATWYTCSVTHRVYNRVPCSVTLIVAVIDTSNFRNTVTRSVSCRVTKSILLRIYQQRWSDTPYNPRHGPSDGFQTNEPRILLFFESNTTLTEHMFIAAVCKPTACVLLQYQVFIVILINDYNPAKKTECYKSLKLLLSSIALIFLVGRNSQSISV